jgi:hypothetical protein
MISDSEVPKKLSKNESIKENSDFLRGTILEGLADDSPAQSPPMIPSSPSFTVLTCRTTEISVPSGSSKSWEKPSPL